MSQNQDEVMADATAGAERPDGLAEEDEEQVQRVIRIVRVNYSICSHTISKLTNFKLPGSTETAASFEFTNEDHTLGNALRHIIMKKCV
jgi:DNA-directed RNA polymerase I and III subunit RPAC2